MSDTRTIFLATDGRYVTAGRGDITLSDQVVAAVAAQSLAGWRVVMSGSLHGARAPKMTRQEAFGGATDAQWGAAVAAFLAQRA